jgi:hypothetical protein
MTSLRRPGLHRSSVEVLDRNAFQVDSFEATNIDCGRPITLWIGPFSVRMNTAGLAKAVFDDVLVERVRADILFRCEHAQLFPWHKPKERSFAGTHGTIACHRAVKFAFDLECNLAAVTAALVLHATLPLPVMFEILYRTLMFFRRRASFEGTKIFSLAGFSVLLARIKPIITGQKLSNHERPPSLRELDYLNSQDASITAAT